MDIQDSTIELEQSLYTPPSNVTDIVHKKECPFRTYTSPIGSMELILCNPNCMALIWTSDQSAPMIQCLRLVRGNLELDSWFD